MPGSLPGIFYYFQFSIARIVIGGFRCYFNNVTVFPDVLVQGFVERVTGKRGGISQNDEFHAGTGDCHVHPAEVVEESDVPVCVGSHETDEDYIPFLSLKPVHGVNGDELFQRLEEAVPFDQLTDILHLYPVGGYQPEINSFIQHPFYPDFLDIFL